MSGSRTTGRKLASDTPRLPAYAHANVASGSGGDAVEAIAGLLSIARLPPGHDPGACYGVATAARQRWHLAIRHFGLFGGPLAAANDWRTNKPTNDTCARPSGRDDAAGARPGGSRRSRRSRPTTAITAGHGQPRRSWPVTAVTAGHGRTFRTRGHGPGVTNQARTVPGQGAPSGHDLSTALTAVVTAAAAPPGSRPGAPGAAPTRSSARWLVNGEPWLRCGDRRGGGNHHPIQGLEVETPLTPTTHDGL